MKKFSITFCFLVIGIFSYASFSHGFSMADYWAVKEGNVLVYDRELIVSGPETRTFGGYNGREYLFASYYNDTQPFVYVGTAGVLLVGLYDKEEGSSIDLSGYPVVISAAQMNLGAPVTSTVPAGILEPNSALVVTAVVEKVESVTVPAGTFSDCLKLKISIAEASGNYTEYVWLAKTVGPVQMFRVSETNNTDGCFFTCASIDPCSDQIGERYTKLKGYYQQGATRVVVVPLGR